MVMLVAMIAVVVFVMQERIGARRCQEECDAEFAACQAACQSECQGFDETCTKTCLVACTNAYDACTFGAMGCGSSFSGYCVVNVGWHNGYVWYSSIDYCVSYPSGQRRRSDLTPRRPE